MKTNLMFLAATMLSVGLAATTPNYPAGFVPKNLNAVCLTENKGQVSDQHHKPRSDVLFSVRPKTA